MDSPPTTASRMRRFQEPLFGAAFARRAAHDDVDVDDVGAVVVVDGVVDVDDAVGGVGVDDVVFDDELSYSDDFDGHKRRRDIVRRERRRKKSRILAQRNPSLRRL